MSKKYVKKFQSPSQVSSGVVTTENGIIKNTPAPKEYSPEPEIKKDKAHCVLFGGVGSRGFKIDGKLILVEFKPENEYLYISTDEKITDKLDELGYKRIED